MTILAALLVAAALCAGVIGVMVGAVLAVDSYTAREARQAIVLLLPGAALFVVGCVGAGRVLS